MIVVSSGELVYLVVVLQKLLLCWVLSMAEAGTAIRIQPLWLWLCGDGSATHFLLAPGDRSAATRNLLLVDLVQEEKEPDILNSSTNSNRGELLRSPYLRPTLSGDVFQLVTSKGQLVSFFLS